MHFEGQQTIDAPINTVWQYFLDPHKVASCTPGYESMEILGPDHFKPKIGVGIGAVRATFTLDVTLLDLRPPTHAAATARGDAPGSAVEVRGEMDLTSESPSKTILRWTADVNVMGKVASMGARLLESVANKLTNEFFTCVRQKLETTTTAAAAPAS